MTELVDSERHLLRQRWLIAVLGCGALLVLVTMFGVLVGNGLTLPAPFNRGQAWLALPILLWWLWVLRRQPRLALALMRDLRTGQAGVIAGTSVVLQLRGIGWLAPMRLKAVVAGQVFAADRFAPADLLAGQQVLARYAPQSATLLAVAPQQLQPPPATVPRKTEDEWSERERRLLQLLAAGQSDKLIARECGLSPATVRTYNSALFRKLGVANRAEAVAKAREAGMLTVN